MKPHGMVAPGFERVADTFAENFSARRDTGSAFAAVIDDEIIVDLWGGTADERTGAQWTSDTVSVLHSGTKGLVATALLLLVQRGLLDLDRPVAAYWPEFAVAGKADITVALLAAHAAGLPGLEGDPLTMDELRRPDAIAARLAAQLPMVRVGVPCYHAFTFGWLCDELVRRIDGRTVGQFVADEIATPLELDVRIGLPPGDPLAAKVSHLQRADDYQLAAFLAPHPDPRLALVYGAAGDVMIRMDDPVVLALEIPAANGVASARSMASLFGAMTTSKLITSEVMDLGCSLASFGDDPLTGRPLRFGPTGFELAHTPSALGPPDDAFGHTGAGGSSHGAWRELRLGFSYSTNMLRPENADGRARALLDALHDAARRAA